jgi:ubiquinone biosynthesis protein
MSSIHEVRRTEREQRHAERRERRRLRRAEQEARYAAKQLAHAEKRAQRKTEREAYVAEHRAESAERREKRQQVRAERRIEREQQRAVRERQLDAREPMDARTQIKLALKALDAVLVAVEKTAWQVREIGESVRSAWSGSGSGTGEDNSNVRQLRKAVDWPKRIARLGQSGLVLGRVGAAYRLHTTRVAFMSRDGATLARAALHEDSARRLYELSIKQGGAFLKLGQMLSSRPDLIPEPYVRWLGKLQDAAPPVPFALIRAAVEAELGQKLDSVFASFDEAPLASASIGQVHRARLLDGREVAVKVQRPQIGELVALDMDLLEIFVRALAQNLPGLDFDTIIRETRAMVTAELDYEREATLTAQLSAYFQADANIHVPQVLRATPRMLVTALMPGQKITDVLDRMAAQGDRDQLSALLARVLEAYARQVLEVGVFQADPHPGNMLATDQGALTVLDFGCAKEVEPARRAILLDLIAATVMRDTERMTDAMVAFGFVMKSGTREGVHALARAAISQMSLASEQGFVSQLQMVSGIASFGKHLEGDPIERLPDEFVMLGRVFGTLSGLFVHYQPDLAATRSVLPIVMTALMQRQAA